MSYAEKVLTAIFVGGHVIGSLVNLFLMLRRLCSKGAKLPNNISVSFVGDTISFSDSQSSDGTVRDGAQSVPSMGARSVAKGVADGDRTELDSATAVVETITPEKVSNDV